MKFRTKSVVVDAWQVRAGEQDGDLAYAVANGMLRYCEDGSVLVRTTLGVCEAKPGDYITRDVRGVLSTCGPDAFHSDYEAVGKAPCKLGDYELLADRVRAIHAAWAATHGYPDTMDERETIEQAINVAMAAICENSGNVRQGQ